MSSKTRRLHSSCSHWRLRSPSARCWWEAQPQPDFIPRDSHLKIFHHSIRVVENDCQGSNNLLSFIAHLHDLSYHILMRLTCHNCTLCIFKELWPRNISWCTVSWCWAISHSCFCCLFCTFLLLHCTSRCRHRRCCQWHGVVDAYGNMGVGAWSTAGAVGVLIVQVVVGFDYWVAAGAGIVNALGFVTITSTKFFSSLLYSFRAASSLRILPA